MIFHSIIFPIKNSTGLDDPISRGCRDLGAAGVGETGRHPAADDACVAAGPQGAGELTQMDLWLFEGGKP